MKPLYVLMSWSEDLDILWINFLTFVSVFCSVKLSCSMIIHIYKDEHKVMGDINSMNLLVLYMFFLLLISQSENSSCIVKNCLL